MNNQLIFLVNTLTKKNNIKMDKEETKLQLLSHPYFPSLNCVTDLFNHFNIDNLALKVDNNFETLSQIPDTFLAQIEEDKSSELVVVTKNKDNVELIYNEHKIKRIGIENFLKLWTGILVVIEKPEKINTPKSNKIINFKKLVAFITLVVLGFKFLSAKPSVFELIHFTLSCFGVYVSYLIVQHELGLHSNMLDKFCSGQNKKTNCDAVLSSKGASIFGLFKLSDVGLVYFTSLVLAWLIIALNNIQSNSIFFVLSTLAIPFTFISIYYQWRVVKNWCPLCLTIVGVLWLQFGALFIDNIVFEKLITIDSSYLLFGISILTIVSLWILLQPLLKKEQQFEKLKIEHIKFKRNFNLFKVALNINTPIDTNISLINELVFGDEKASLKLMVVTNPMCGFCKESHKLVENILKNENQDIQIIIRFNVRSEDEEAKGTKIAAKLLELYNTTNKKNCLNALSDIYGDMDAEIWLNTWGEAVNSEYIAVLKKEKEWCTNNKINFTPAILINGKQYPKEYDRMDLLYFIDDLIEEQKDFEDVQPQTVNY